MSPYSLFVKAPRDTFSRLTNGSTLHAHTLRDVHWDPLAWRPFNAFKFYLSLPIDRFQDVHAGESCEKAAHD